MWKRRFWIALTTAALALCGLAIASAGSAFAYTTHCGKFNGSDPSISYRYYDVTSTWNTAFGGAQSDWDGKPVPGVFTYAPTDGDPMVSVNDGSYVPTAATK